MNKNKYIDLMIAILLSIAGFFLLLTILFFALRYFVAGLNMIPGVLKGFSFCILSLPAFILFSVFAIYIRRNKLHPSPIVRGLSYVLLGAGLLAIPAVYGVDVYQFFKTGKTDVTEYYVYSRYFIVSGISLLFIIATIQALTTEKEVDWMARNQVATETNEDTGTEKI
jgi:hypothetical protein